MKIQYVRYYATLPCRSQYFCYCYQIHVAAMNRYDLNNKINEGREKDS